MDKNLRNDEVIRISNEILKQKNYNIEDFEESVVFRLY